MTSRGEPGDVDDEPDLPLDPDVDVEENRRPVADPPTGPFPRTRRSRWPRIHWATVLAVVVGGFVGGIVRYAVGLALPAGPGAFPWAVFAVNTGGAFVLALLLVLLLEVLPPTTYLRPVLGTGFCGALTTFSSVAAGVDQLAARGAPGTAAGYAAASLLAGLVAAALGLVLGRAISGHRRGGE